MNAKLAAHVARMRELQKLQGGGLVRTVSRMKPYDIRWHRLGFQVEIISYPFTLDRGLRGSVEVVMTRLIPEDPTTMVRMETSALMPAFINHVKR